MNPVWNGSVGHDPVVGLSTPGRFVNLTIAMMPAISRATTTRLAMIKRYICSARGGPQIHPPPAMRKANISPSRSNGEPRCHAEKQRGNDKEEVAFIHVDRAAGHGFREPEDEMQDAQHNIHRSKSSLRGSGIHGSFLSDGFRMPPRPRDPSDDSEAIFSFHASTIRTAWFIVAASAMTRMIGSVLDFRK
jgi:hypothetical protein